MNKPTEKIWAVSMAPGARQVAVHVNKRIIGSPAWRIHKMKEVADPNLDPEPHKIAGRPTKLESVTIERLRKEKEDADAEKNALQAKLDAALAQIEASKVEVKKPKTEKA